MVAITFTMGFLEEEQAHQSPLRQMMFTR